MYETVSLLPSILCCNYDVALKYYEAGRNKDFETLKTIDSQIMRARAVLDQTLPVGAIDGAYDKCFDRIHNESLSQRLYPPYHGTSDEQYVAFKEQMIIQIPEWF